MGTEDRGEGTPDGSGRVAALVARLRKGAAHLERVLSGLTGDEWARVAYPGPPTWTVRDLVAHLVSAEDGLRGLGQDIVAGGAGAPEGVDHDELNAAEQERLATVEAPELLRDVLASRQATMAWVETLGDGDLDRIGRHPALGEISVESHISAMYGHALMHLRDLQRVVAPRR